jgi:hypothetical protein
MDGKQISKRVEAEKQNENGRLTEIEADGTVVYASGFSI